MARARREARGGYRRAPARAVLALIVLATAHAAGPAPRAATGQDAARAPAQELRRAAELLRDNRVGDALALLQGLNARYPADPVPYNELAVLHAGRGELERARELLAAALDAEPRYAVVFRNLQAVFGELAGRAYDRALMESRAPRAPPPLASLLQAPDGAAGTPVTLVASTTSTVPSPVAEPAPAASPDPPRPAPRAAGAGAAKGPDAGPGAAAPAPQVAVAAPAAAAAPAPAAAPDPAAPGAVIATVRAWAAAWAAQDVDRYLGHYGHHFTPPGGLSAQQWREQRRQRVGTPRFIEVEVADIQVAFPAERRAVARFRQRYRSDRLDSVITKVLHLSRDGGGWKITREAVDR